MGLTGKIPTKEERLRKERDALGDALKILFYDLHPVYANTSYRGRGVGGQAMTQQCSVVRPEGFELDQIAQIEELIRDHLIQREIGR